MGKNIYEMLNEACVDFSEYNEQDLSQFEKNKIKRNLNKNNNLKKYILACSLLIISMALLNNDIVAYAKEKIQEIAYDISEFFGINTNLDDYITTINKSTYKNGIYVNLEEVLLNNDEIIIKTMVKSDKNQEEYPGGIFIEPKYISINGNKIDGYSSGSGGGIDEYSTIITKYTLKDMGELDLKDEIDIKIVYENAYIGENYKIKGPWVIEFTAGGKELAAKTEDIELNKTFKLENGDEIKLEKYTRNDISEKIYASLNLRDESINYDMYIKGTNNEGGILKLRMENWDSNEFIFNRKDNSMAFNFNGESVKGLKLELYVAEIKDGKMPEYDDYKSVGEQFIIE